METFLVFLSITFQIYPLYLSVSEVLVSLIVHRDPLLRKTDHARLFNLQHFTSQKTYILVKFTIRLGTVAEMMLRGFARHTYHTVCFFVFRSITFSMCPVYLSVSAV